MKVKQTGKLTDWEDIMEQRHGKAGTPAREAWEEGFEAFRLGVLIQQMREEQKLTQEQLAQKCGTTKSYISRIENNASDIRLSTLMRIIREGLGGRLRLSVDF